jgi:hypothetical protein
MADTPQVLSPPEGYMVSYQSLNPVYYAASKGAHTRTSQACESSSGSLTREPGSDIFHHTHEWIPARDPPHTDEFDSLEPGPNRTREPDS